jgi:hypothetical protein
MLRTRIQIPGAGNLCFLYPKEPGSRTKFFRIPDPKMTKIKF